MNRKHNPENKECPQSTCTDPKSVICCDDCTCPSEPKENYVDSMTPEERAHQNELQKSVVITTASSEPNNQIIEEKRCNQCVLENNNGICDRKDCSNSIEPKEEESHQHYYDRVIDGEWKCQCGHMMERCKTHGGVKNPNPDSLYCCQREKLAMLIPEKPKEDTWNAISPLVEKMKAKYPPECNIEGLEPALTQDIIEIVHFHHIKVLEELMENLPIVELDGHSGIRQYVNIADLRAKIEELKKTT